MSFPNPVCEVAYIIMCLAIIGALISTLPAYTASRDTDSKKLQRWIVCFYTLEFIGIGSIFVALAALIFA